MTYNPSPQMARPIAMVAPAPVRVSTAKPYSDAISTELLAEHRCLSEVLYYEARGEGRAGQQAIAEVVFHRMNTGNYGHSICAVVYEGAGHPHCQFTFTCNGDLTKAKEDDAWRESEVLAAQILTGEVPLHNATGGATNFHAVSVTPDWAETMDETTQIGNHIFYRGQVVHSDS
jgi:spore germination cell wall hydrolase CwlJ-like protein